MSAGSTSVAQEAQARAVWALDVVKALAGSAQPPRLWFVTERAQPVESGDRVTVASAPLWGLGRVVAQEYPELRCSLVDVEPGDIGSVWQTLMGADDEPEVAWRRGSRYVNRLVRAGGAKTTKAQVPRDSEGVVVVTGGLGALGLHVARWLVEERGERQLVLLGRGEPTQSQQSAVEALRVLGAHVIVARVEVADALELQQLFAKLPKVRGVVHAAGTLDDGLLVDLNERRFASVFAGKVHGAWNLHEITKALQLDFFVLFSAAASLWGAAGQGNYAAANAFLDGLAHFRRSQGLAGQSLNWGPWAGAGMASTLNAAQRTRLERLGVAL